MTNTSKCSTGNNAKKQREEMIERELQPILDAAQDFCYEHYEDDMENEAIQAIKTAAATLAYRKKYFDVMKDMVVYFPSCSNLILSREIFEEAERNYYEVEDQFPAEYAKALCSVVFAEEDAKSGKGEINDEEFMDKLALEWTEAL